MKKDDENREVFRALALFTQLGISMAACVPVGAALGIWLDRRLGTSPWMLLAGALLGGAASVKVLYDLAMGNRKK